MSTELVEKASGKTQQLKVVFEYNGEVFPDKVTLKQKIEAAWHRALAHFGISPGDAQNQNLALFRDGNEVSRSQTFEEAGIASEAILRISPRVQRAG